MVTRSKTSGTALAAILVLALMVALGTTAAAQSAAKAGEGQTAAADKGKLRQPTHEEMKELGVDLKQQTTGLRTITTPQGAVGVDLEGGFESVMVVKKSADGTLSSACVTSEKEAKDFLKAKKQSAKPAPALEEK